MRRISLPLNLFYVPRSLRDPDFVTMRRNTKFAASPLPKDNILVCHAHNLRLFLESLQEVLLSLGELLLLLVRRGG